MNNSIQYDNNNIYPSTNTSGLFNQPSTFASSQSSQSSQSSPLNPLNQSTSLNGQTSTVGGGLGNMGIMSSMGGLGGMGNMGGMGGMGGMNPITSNLQLDPMLFNGTTLDDDTGFNTDYNTSYNKGLNSGLNSGINNQDPTLIKSVAREIINGLKENNMSLYDNSSINSYKNNNLYQVDEDLKDYTNENLSSVSKKSKSSKSKNKVKEVVETIEDFVIDANSSNSTKSYSDYAGWFFDECFNYKDFLILFILYFVLSQEMIKDFFAKYFSSLNPDYEGKIGVQGVIIYGLILTILFMIIKKMF